MVAVTQVPKYGIDRQCLSKKRYSSEKAALSSHRSVAKKHRGRITGNVRVYLCPHCDGYHITTKSPNWKSLPYIRRV